MTYENIVNLVQSNDQALFPDMTPEEIDDLGLYEDVPIETTGVNNQELYYNQPEINNALKNELKTGIDSSMQRTSFIPNVVPTYQPLSSDKDTQEGRKQINRPPIAPKPKFNKDTQSHQAAAPALPVRPESKYRKVKAGTQNAPENNYTNILPTNSVVPTVQPTQPHLPREGYQGLKSTSPDEGKYQSLSRSISCRRDVAGLSVKEVCEYLRALNLSKYEANFKEHMIDGAMLVELEPELFQEEFGMKKIEVVRLMKFAKEGRLPIQSK
jgi:hypothetical protein